MNKVFYEDDYTIETINYIKANKQNIDRIILNSRFEEKFRTQTIFQSVLDIMKKTMVINKLKDNVVCIVVVNEEEKITWEDDVDYEVEGYIKIKNNKKQLDKIRAEYNDKIEKLENKYKKIKLITNGWF